MNKTNKIIGLIFIVFSVITFIWAFSFPDVAKFWPQLFSIVMIILSLGLIISSNKKSSNETEEFVPDRSEYISLVILIGISIISLLLFNVIGFSIVTILLIASILWYTEYRVIKNVVLVSIGTSVVLTVVFQFLLKVPLPQGVFQNLF